MSNLNPLEIERLLAKLQQSTISQEELTILEAYLNEDGNLNKAWKKNWDDLVESDTELLPVKNLIFEKLKQNNSNVLRANRKYIQRFSVAAAVVFLIISVLVINKTRSLKWTDVQNPTLAISEIQLPDKSTVWLTPNSAIRYNSAFGKKDRVVLLNGQARFDVTTDSTSTFLVKTEFVETRVLGTNFTVHAYDGLDKVEVALHEGGVQVQVNGNVQATKLHPGETLLYQKATGSIRKNEIKNVERFQWQDGIIRFNKAGVVEVKDRLKEWYGVEISVEGDTAEYEKLIYRIDTRKLDFEKVIAGIDLVSNYSIHKIDKYEYVIRKKK